MEEVDEIVIHTLRQIGCNIEDISSLREFTTELVIEGVVRCLKLINPDLELSHHVPPGMSARYRLGSSLASACTDLGFKGEIGYQTFLYSNESDLRKIFLFLVEKLPKESEKVLDEPLGKTALVLRECALYLSECLNTPWMPHYCRSVENFAGKLLLKNCLTSSMPFQSCAIFIPRGNLNSSYSKKYLPLLPKQVTSQSKLMCSLFEDNLLNYLKENKNEWNEEHLSSKLTRKELNVQKEEQIQKKILGLLAQSLQQKKASNYESFGELLDTNFSRENQAIKGSRFVHSLQLQFTSDNKETLAPPGAPLVEPGINNEEEKQKKRENEVSELQTKIDETATKLLQLELQNKKFESSLQQISDLINKEMEKIDNVKEIYRVKKCTLSLLPDAENNIEKLQGLIEGSSQRLISLATQWEQHRVPLVEKYRELKELSSQRLNETQKKLEEIKELRDKIRDTGVEARHKDEMHKQLTASYEKLTKDVNRSAYTRRILEIVGNIKKQKAEIDKVLLDTRNVQKEINRLSGKLERTFTVTDELIFRDAKKDEAVRRAYKYLAALHENCSQLVQIIEETGFIVREIREIEDQIEQENQKKVAATLERITSDYKQMQQENSSLIAQLK